jgi:hypothetical protein
VLVTVGRDLPPMAPAGRDRTALLFSGGVDSMYSLHRMEREGWLPDLLVNINAGSHDLDRVCWGRRLERLDRVAGELGIPLVTIDTNLHELGWVSHAAVHLFRNAPAASVLRTYAGVMVYSSGHRLEATSFEETHRQASLLMEPVVVDAMRWGGLELLLLGNDVRRMDKLATLPDTRFGTRFLDICTDQRYQATAGPQDKVNCGRCFKCARTIALFERMGIADRFAHLIDLAAYEDVRAETERDLLTGTTHQRADARWLFTAPPGELPSFRRGWLPPEDPDAPLNVPW